MGYNNLTDKPDLTGYLTKSEFKVTADQIRAEVGRANQTAGGTKAQLDAFQQQTQQNVNNLLSRQATADDKIYRLQTAGYITTAQGNALYASAQLANGKTIASYITQSPEAINMISRNININAAVTFESYKEDNAQKLAAVNRRVSNAETQLDNKQGRNDTFDINNARLNGKTVIEGGLIKTELINTKNLVVERAAMIGDFKVKDGTIIYKDSIQRGAGQTGTWISAHGSIDLRSESGPDSCAKLYTGGLTITTQDFAPRVIDCSHGSVANFAVEFRARGNDPSWNKRTCIIASNMPHVNTIKAEGGSPDFRTVKINTKTGLFCWE